MKPTGKSLRARAVDLLSRREYSRRELFAKLAPHADSAAEVDVLLDELAERGWQSDTRFAEQTASSKGQRYGSRRLAAELRDKGVAAETIEQALAGQDDVALARALWRKKFGKKPQSREEWAKQMRFLAGRGLPMDAIRRALDGVDADDFAASDHDD
ncbi:recombination regulator RecX [Crenobacter luteus]|uniref:Regulatory protein RecX n=1 Tax=Crenobacter luteus TaxID=1452487 RepID=A0A161SBI2_9NEIS|nr:recombination regulator RecX [Crenobacter luteus]KZE27242.1 recombinase RecX [Crenobacter luteus]